MPVSPVRARRLALAVGACWALAACGTLDNMSQGIASTLTPYKVEVVQGNFVSREQVEALKPGMSRQNVREILGTPLVTSLFHDDRWDYVFTIKRQGVEPQERRLTVYFQGDALLRTEGDTMPSEAEFVATLVNKRKKAKVPQLQASEESLEKFSRDKAQTPAPAAPVAAPQASYPPLEPASR